jgi:hypothetical protein
MPPHSSIFDEAISASRLFSPVHLFVFIQSLAFEAVVRKHELNSHLCALSTLGAGLCLSLTAVYRIWSEPSCPGISPFSHSYSILCPSALPIIRPCIRAVHIILRAPLDPRASALGQCAGEMVCRETQYIMVVQLDISIMTLGRML